MTKQEIIDKLFFIVKDIKGDVKVDENTALIESGLLDSLEVINYLTQIEEFMELSISLDELVDNQLGIIKNMADFILEKSK